MRPGEYILKKDKIVCNASKEAITLRVINGEDRAIQIGSHFHFYEVNSILEFDRAKAYGKRLNIAAGTAVRFEPGDEKEVKLIDIGGNRKVYGLNDKINGALD